MFNIFKDNVIFKIDIGSWGGRGVSFANLTHGDTQILLFHLVIAKDELTAQTSTTNHVKGRSGASVRDTTSPEKFRGGLKKTTTDGWGGQKQEGGV